MKDDVKARDARPHLVALTQVRAAPLTPEIALHLAPEGQSLDAFRAAHEAQLGPALPYWAIAWPGGQALARYLLDRPETVAGKSVVDCGAGCGLAAIAAALAGAVAVRALDRDTNALAATRLNAALNQVSIETQCQDLAAATIQPGEIVLAGDLWYERFDARRATTALRRWARQGCTVLVGDPA